MDKQMKYILIPVFLTCVIIINGKAQDAPDVEPALQDASDSAKSTALMESLGKLVGTWVDQGEDATIITRCSWTKNKKFLKRSFRLKVDDEDALEGEQFVGWDPAANQIRSWTFDSEGGFGEGVWIQDGNRWLVKSAYVLADGSKASSLNIYTIVDQDTIRWQSTNREIAGELQPNIPEVTVVRQKMLQDEKGGSQ